MGESTLIQVEEEAQGSVLSNLTQRLKRLMKSAPHVEIEKTTVDQ